MHGSNSIFFTILSNIQIIRADFEKPDGFQPSVSGERSAKVPNQALEVHSSRRPNSRFITNAEPLGSYRTRQLTDHSPIDSAQPQLVLRLQYTMKIVLCLYAQLCLLNHSSWVGLSSSTTYKGGQKTLKAWFMTK